MKKNLKTREGITLIALIITIIVMLILVAVTINMAINGGLFEKAGEAVGDTKNAINAEQKLADGKIKIGDKWYASIDDYLAGKELIELPEGIKVGDYVNYTPDTGTYKVADGATGSGRNTTDPGYQEFTTGTGLKWRVWSIDEETGEVEIVLATTGPRLTLQGADGYNHAVDILNDLCESLYSKKVNGKKVATGRSINVEDINAKTTYDYTTFERTDTGYKYGQKIPLSQYSSSYRKYPKLYAQETGYAPAGIAQIGLDGETGLKNGTTDESKLTTYPEMGYANDYTEQKDIYVTDTYYGYNGSKYTYYPENCLDTSLGLNTAPTGLIKLSNSYWLASRCVFAYSSYAYFDVRYMDSSGFVDYYVLFNSNGSSYNPSFAVRPVVSLGSNVSLEYDAANSTGSTTYWTAVF